MFRVWRMHWRLAMLHRRERRWQRKLHKNSLPTSCGPLDLSKPVDEKLVQFLRTLDCKVDFRVARPCQERAEDAGDGMPWTPMSAYGVEDCWYCGYLWSPPGAPCHHCGAPDHWTDAAIAEADGR